MRQEGEGVQTVPFATPGKLLSVLEGQGTTTCRTAAPWWRKCCPAPLEMLSQAFCTFPAGSQGPGEEHGDLEKQETRTRLGSVCEEKQIEGGHKDVGEAVIQMTRMAGETVSSKEGRRIWDPCNTARSWDQNRVQIHGYWHGKGLPDFKTCCFHIYLPALTPGANSFWTMKSSSCVMISLLLSRASDTLTPRQWPLRFQFKVVTPGTTTATYPISTGDIGPVWRNSRIHLADDPHRRQGNAKRWHSDISPFFFTSPLPFHQTPRDLWWQVLDSWDMPELQHAAGETSVLPSLCKWVW